MALDKFGLPSNIRTPSQQKLIQDALGEVEGLKDQWKKLGNFSDGEIKEFADSFVKNSVIDGLQSLVSDYDSPLSPAEGLPTLENEAVHIVNNAQVRLAKKYAEKIHLMNPHDPVASAIKGMQISIDNLSVKINDILESQGSYGDLVARPPTDVDKLIKEAASKNAKYMKVIFNKMMEFTNKTVAAELTTVVSAMPAGKRWMFADMKNLMTQNSLQSFGDIGNGIGGLLAGILKDSLDVDNLMKKAKEKANNPIIPTTRANYKDWIPNMKVNQGDKIKYGNNIYEVTEKGNTGYIVPTHTSKTQKNGTAALGFESFAVGDLPQVGGKGIGIPPGLGSLSSGTIGGGIVPGPTYPKVPMCYAEEVVGKAIAGSKDLIDKANNNTINSINEFLGDIKSELASIDNQMRPKARDTTLLGQVMSFTDEEGLGNNQGGSYYVSEDNVATTGGGNVRPVGLGSTTPGPGGGLTVNIRVSKGGATGVTSALNVDGEWLKLTAVGSGYKTSGSPGSTSGSSIGTLTGGSGTGAECVTFFTGGELTKVSITPGDGGKDYVSGEELNVVGEYGGSGGKVVLVKVRGRIDSMLANPPGIEINNPGRGYEIGELITIVRDEYDNVGGDAKVTITQAKDPGDTVIEAPKSGKGKPQNLASMISKLGNMGGSLTTALDFKNIVGNVFPFELPPNQPVSDVYQIASGGSGLGDTQLPSLKAIGEAALKKLPDNILPGKEIPFVEPPKLEPDVIFEEGLNVAAQVNPQAAAAKAAINVAQGQSVQDAAREAATDIYGV